MLAPDVESVVSHDRLRPILTVSSAGPPATLVTLSEFAAWRWAGPRAVFLRAASPPNVVAPGPAPDADVAVFPEAEAPVPLTHEPVEVVVWPPAEPRDALVCALWEPTGSTIVIVPDHLECDAIAASGRAQGRDVRVLRGDLPDAERTRAWADARHGACIVVGGRNAVFAPVPDLAAVVVLDDADEALTEERAPVWHAREIAARRCQVEGARLVLVSPAPTVEALELAAGRSVLPPKALARRGWPRVEVVDLREEPPGAGLLSRALAPAIQRALDDGRALVVVNRKGRARLLVCRTCGAVAECGRCGARLAEGARLPEGPGVAVCERCAAQSTLQCGHCGSVRFQKLRPGVTGLRDAIAGLVPNRRVVAVDAASAPVPAFDVAVGTEAVLHRVRGDEDRPVRLVAFPEIDQELLAPRYRATEQALWLLVRAARLLGPRDAGGSILVQTRVPDHDVLRAAQTGDPTAVLAPQEHRRRELGYPPFGGLAELSGAPAAVEAACDTLRGGLTVLGPSGGRALLRAPTIAVLCDALAAADLGPARALGRLRIDVDPLRV